MQSSSSVVTPGATAAPVTASTSAATRPATRIRAITSGDFTMGSSQRTGDAGAVVVGGHDVVGHVPHGADPPGEDPALGGAVAPLVLAAAATPAGVVGLREPQAGRRPMHRSGSSFLDQLDQSAEGGLRVQERHRRAPRARAGARRRWPGRPAATACCRAARAVGHPVADVVQALALGVEVLGDRSSRRGSG